MKESTYKTYDDLAAVPNAAMVARVLGVAPSSAYELMHEKGLPNAARRQPHGGAEREILSNGSSST